MSGQPIPPYRESAMSDTSIHHHRLEEYSSRMPTPPRIEIPPPLMLGEEPIKLGPPRFNTDPALNVDFLKDLTTKFAVFHMLDTWSYNDRREAQEILPYLYLGPARTITPEWLSKHRFTLLIGLCDLSEMFIARALRCARELGIDTQAVVVTPQNSLISNFPSVSATINSHLVTTHTQGLEAKVLIFDETGSEKSAAAATAYLMETFDDLPLKQAMRIVITMRFSVNFSPYTQQLSAYEQVIRARHLLSPSSSGMSLPQADRLEISRSRTPDQNEYFRRGRDRFLHNIDDEEFADQERFAGRSGPQPFKSHD
jgi:serine/threonine/tyrosine-interacting protein